MALTELQCSKLKATGTEYQRADEDGLSLVVRLKGTKFWRYEFRLNGKKQKFGYGNYPEIGLADARKVHAVGRQLVEMSRHPAEVLDHVEAKQAILRGSTLDDAETLIHQSEQEAVLEARMTFGAAADRYKSDWVDRNWKNPDKGYTPVRLRWTTSTFPLFGNCFMTSASPPRQ